MPDSPNVRDHLANERTFLAWVRTSISLLGFGVLIAKLRFLIPTAGPQVEAHAGTRSTWLGITFACVGLLTLLLATTQYQRTRQQIDSGTYKPLAGLLLAFAAVLLLLGVASIVYLIAISPK